MRRLPAGRKRPATGRDAQVEFEAAGRSGDVKAVELVAAIRPRSLAPRQGADEEELAARAIGKGRGVRALLHIERREEDVVEQRVVGGRDQQQVLMPVAPVGVRNPKRHPEQIRDRTRQADGAREPHDRSVLPSAREQLRRLRRRRCTGDGKPCIVNDPVGMEGLPAPHGGECRQHRPD